MQPSTIAVFDLDGTLTAGRSIENAFIKYLIKTHRLSADNILTAVIYYLKNVLQDPVEAVKRNKMYLKGRTVQEVSMWISEFMDNHGERLISSAGFDFVRYHKELGHPAILITGAPDILVEKLPIRRLFDIVYATRLEIDNYTYSGRIESIHYYGKAKTSLVKKLAPELHADLGRSYCYADSCDDIEMMSLFGHPVAVHPDRYLKQVAMASRWKIIIT